MFEVVTWTIRDMLVLYVCCIPFIVIGCLLYRKSENNIRTEHRYLGVLAYILLWIFVVFAIGVTCYSNELLENFNIANVTDINKIHHNFEDFFFNILLASLGGNVHAIINLIGNIGLFVPVGFCAMWISYGRKCEIIWVIAKCFLLSFLIEFTQLLTVRLADVVDLILNTAGGAIGCAIFIYLYKLTNGFGNKYRPILEKRVNNKLKYLKVLNVVACAVATFMITNVWL